jgi:hypothetical protein
MQPAGAVQDGTEASGSARQPDNIGRPLRVHPPRGIPACPCPIRHDHLAKVTATGGGDFPATRRMSSWCLLETRHEAHSHDPSPTPSPAGARAIRCSAFLPDGNVTAGGGRAHSGNPTCCGGTSGDAHFLDEDQWRIKNSHYQVQLQPRPLSETKWYGVPPDAVVDPGRGANPTSRPVVWYGYRPRASRSSTALRPVRFTSRRAGVIPSASACWPAIAPAIRGASSASASDELASHVHLGQRP